MIRRIVKIDEEKCIGCGECAEACHESAIGMVNGKAKLLRDDYCDGMGDCLPACPADAISFEERDAAAYDEAAVLANKENKKTVGRGCPGNKVQSILHAPILQTEGMLSVASALENWPVQIKLAPTKAPYFDGAKLLIAADCTAFSYGNFHRDFMQGNVVLIGCSKLDSIDYSEKLTTIISGNDIREVTIVRMEVPCCGGLERAVTTAIQNSGKFLPWHTVTIGIDGSIKK